MKRFLVCLSVSLTLLLSVIAVPMTSAQDPSSGLSYVPRKNLVLNPGKSLKDKLSVSNLSQTGSLDLTIRVVDFSFYNETGTPKLFLAANAPQTPWSVKPFITIPKHVSVPPGQTRTIDYSLKVPKGQGAGSYYSAIVYTTGSGEGGNVNLSASGVTLMFLSVPGTVKEDMTLQKFGSYQSSDEAGADGDFTFINLDAPKRMAFRLKNEGNVAESPSGSIVIKNMWGKQVYKIDNINPDSSLAIIGQTRRFLSCIKPVPKDVDTSGTTSNGQCEKPSFMPGRYTASLDLFYGQNGNQTREIQGTATFWYIPVWFIIAVAVILLIILYAILRIRYRIKHPRNKKFRARS